jgi:hypothetical protein
MEFPVSVDQRMAGAEEVGAHRTSMLQDLEAGRPMELGALVAAVVELGERLNLSMQYTGTVYSCVKLLAQRAAPRLRPPRSSHPGFHRPPGKCRPFVPAPKTVLFGA